MKEQLTRAREVEVKQNGYWAANIWGETRRVRTSPGLLAAYDQMVSGLTAAQIQDAVEEVLQHGELRAIRPSSGDRKDHHHDRCNGRWRFCSIAGLRALAAQIPESEFAARRDSLARRIDSGVVIAFGGRTPVTDFGPFYQLPAFHYLTNFDEPDAAMVMVVRGGNGSTTLFITPAEPRAAFYYGWRPDSAADPADSRRQRALVRDARRRSPIRWRRRDCRLHDRRFRGRRFLARRLAHARTRVRPRRSVRDIRGLVVKDAHSLVDQLRAKKSAAELALMRQAAEISAEGHRAAMLAPMPSHEYELQAVLEYKFTRLGGERPAYGSIVGSGAERHAAALHEGPRRDETRRRRRHGRGGGVRRLCRRHHAHDSGERHVHAGAARDLSARARRPGRGGTELEAGDVGVGGAGFIGRGAHPRAGRARADRERGRASFDPPWQANCERTPRRASRRLLDDSRHQPRPWTRRARSGAVLVRRPHVSRSATPSRSSRGSTSARGCSTCCPIRRRTARSSPR